MQLKSEFNKNKWVSYFACYITDLNLVFTHNRKSETIRIVPEIVNIIKTRFNAKIIFIRLDKKKSLNKEFQDFLDEKDIIFESLISNSSK